MIAALVILVVLSRKQQAEFDSEGSK
jgi:hypothetical protein